MDSLPFPGRRSLFLSRFLSFVAKEGIEKANCQPIPTPFFTSVSFGVPLHFR